MHLFDCVSLWQALPDLPILTRATFLERVWLYILLIFSEATMLNIKHEKYNGNACIFIIYICVYRYIGQNCADGSNESFWNNLRYNIAVIQAVVMDHEVSSHRSCVHHEGWLETSQPVILFYGSCMVQIHGFSVLINGSPLFACYRYNT